MNVIGGVAVDRHVPLPDVVEILSELQLPDRSTGDKNLFEIYLKNLNVGKKHGTVHNGTKIPLINNNLVDTTSFHLYFKTRGFTIFKASPWTNRSSHILKNLLKF